VKTKQLLLFGGGIALGVGVIFLIRNVLLKQSHFDLRLFDSPDLPGSGKRMNKAFLKKLRKVEKLAGFTFKYNSAYRTPEHNRSVGGVEDSAHVFGKAVDIQAPNRELRDKVVWAAKKVGFKRIGIGLNMVHLDDDHTKPQYVAWGYPIGTDPPYNPFA